MLKGKLQLPTSAFFDKSVEEMVGDMGVGRFWLFVVPSKKVVID